MQKTPDGFTDIGFVLEQKDGEPIKIDFAGNLCGQPMTILKMNDHTTVRIVHMEEDLPPEQNPYYYAVHQDPKLHDLLELQAEDKEIFRIALAAVLDAMPSYATKTETT